MKKIILLVITALIWISPLSSYAESFVQLLESLSKPDIFSNELQEHRASWFGKRLNSLLQSCLEEKNVDHRAILIHLIALRYGDLLISREGPIFLQEIPARQYISIHKKLNYLVGEGDPKKSKAIETFMLEYWPKSPPSVNTVRKFIYLLGVLQKRPALERQIDVETMLSEFRAAHPEGFKKMKLSQIANHFFYYLTVETVTGALNLTSTEYLGFRELAQVIHGPMSNVTPGTLDEVCNYFMKNVNRPKGF